VNYSMDHTQTFKGSCHCGNVQFELTNIPEWLTSCNCSICTKLGTIWAHDEISSIILKYDVSKTSTYIWGDKTLAFHTCKTCGCTTHWESLDSTKLSRMGVNFKMCSEHDISRYRVRTWDGANSNRYLN